MSQQPININDVTPSHYNEISHQSITIPLPYIQVQAYESTEYLVSVTDVLQIYSSCSRGDDHKLKTNFTLDSLLYGTLFFPIGILCCLYLTEERCTKCEKSFDKKEVKGDERKSSS